MTHSSPSEHGAACASTPGSEPASGSESANAGDHSPVAHRGQEALLQLVGAEELDRQRPELLDHQDQRARRADARDLLDAHLEHERAGARSRRTPRRTAARGCRSRPAACGRPTGTPPSRRSPPRGARCAPARSAGWCPGSPGTPAAGSTRRSSSASDPMVVAVPGSVRLVATGSSVLDFARRRDPRIEVRPARPGEPVARTLDEAGFGPHVARLLGYPRDSPARRDPRRRDAARAARRRRVHARRFGATGWIGALGVLPRARRRGVGELLTRACVEWLRSAARSTVAALRDRDGPAASTSARASSPRRRRAPGAARRRARRRTASAACGPSDRDGDPRARPRRDRRGPLRRARPPPRAARPRARARRTARSPRYALNTPWGAGPAVVAEDFDGGHRDAPRARRSSRSR